MSWLIDVSYEGFSLEVYYTPPVPAKLAGPPEMCDPGEGAQVEGVRVHIDDPYSVLEWVVDHIDEARAGRFRELTDAVLLHVMAASAKQTQDLSDGLQRWLRDERDDGWHDHAYEEGAEEDRQHRSARI